MEENMKNIAELEKRLNERQAELEKQLKKQMEEQKAELEKRLRSRGSEMKISLVISGETQRQQACSEKRKKDRN